MSQENVEIARRSMDAFTAEGVDVALRFFTPDCVWYTTDRWLDGSAYRGHDGIRRLAGEFSDNFDDVGFEVQEIRDADDRVAALLYMNGRIKNTAVPIRQTLGLVIAGFRNGMFAEVRAFPSWHEALKAVGLEE
jgi:ketosteroid isomerase-like protein